MVLSFRLRFYQLLCYQKGSNVVKLDRIYNKAYKLSQNIYVITKLFITNNYLSEMITKFIFTEIIFLN